MLLERIEKGEIDPSFVITHRAPLEEGPEMYKTFRDKKDGCIKVVLKPVRRSTNAICHRHRRHDGHRARARPQMRQEGFELLIAADGADIETAASTVRGEGATVERSRPTCPAERGRRALPAAARDVQVDALLANAGRGLGHGFLDQNRRRLAAV